MAEIFLAKMSSGLAEKLVVLKKIRPELAGEREFVTMFLDEARIAATLQHPNIVQTYEADVMDGAPFIAMEYLHGEDVGTLMWALSQKSQKLELPEALAILISICSGLHHAHEGKGLDGSPLEIVHRDVTPQNVIVTYDGSVKLVDFGIARANKREARTRYGTIKGKVPYMSPEQCKNEPLDRRSDLFSVGILLWELTLGKRLYRGASDFEVLKQIVEGQPPRPRQIDGSYDPALEAIVMRALEKDRARRVSTARELQDALEEFARKKQLRVSSIALQQLMERAFAERIAEWERARSEGKSLAEHLQTLPEKTVIEEKTEEPLAVKKRAPLWILLAVPSLLAGVWLLRPHERVPIAIAPLPSPVASAPVAPSPIMNKPTSLGMIAPVIVEHHKPHIVKKGTLVILSSPQCEVSIDEVHRGSTPLELELPSGTHQVMLENRKFRIARKLEVTVPPGGTVRKKLDFAE
jgi:serine/threonine protein kinase